MSTKIKKMSLVELFQQRKNIDKQMIKRKKRQVRIVLEKQGFAYGEFEHNGKIFKVKNKKL